MHKEAKYYMCEDCSSILELVEGKGAHDGAGVKLREIHPNTSEGAGEKHIPEVEVQGNAVTVRVGSILHPMVKEHYIGWVAVHTDHGMYRRDFETGREPETKFLLEEDETISAVYAYCNEHGLWERSFK